MPSFPRILVLTTALWLLASGSLVRADAMSGPREVVTLEEFRVNDTAESALRPESAFTATKTNTSLLDTPQSISVVTEALLAEQQAFKFGDALRNVASVTRTSNFLGAYEGFSSRGFSLNNGSNYLRNGRTYFHLASPPMESVERLEILKGPSGVLYGQGAPGGMINLITKRPTPRPFTSLKTTVGSEEFYQAHIDTGGPIGERLGYRTNLVYQDSGSFRDFVFVRRKLAALAVNWEPLSNTTVLFNFDVLDDDRPQDTGTVALGNRVFEIPDHRVYNLPWGRYNSDIWNAGLNAQTRLSSAWTLYSGYNFQDYRRVRVDQQFSGLNETTGNFTNITRLRVNRYRFDTLNLDLTGQVGHGAVQHTLLLGANGIRTTLRNNETRTNVRVAQNLFDPVFTTPRPDFDVFPKPNRGRDKTLGIYAQDQISLGEKWDILLGLRFDRFSTYFYDENIAQPKIVATTENVTPRAGLVFKLTLTTSLYASYSESFEPNGYVSQGSNLGTLLDPTTGDQLEAGIKSELLDRKLTLTAALFTITRANVPYYDAPSDLTVQRGEQRHRGVELDVFGQLTPDWSITASAMLLDAEYTRDLNPALVGRSPAGVPETTLGFWSSYRFPRGRLAGLTLSAGANHQSNRNGDPLGTFALGRFTRVDAAASYRWKLDDVRTLTLRWNVENLLDERYYFGTDRLNVALGNPLGWKFAAELTF